MDIQLESIAAIIFDMDGVLINSDRLHEQSHAMVMRKYGIDLKEPREHFRGRTVMDMMTEIQKNYHVDATPKELYDCRNFCFLELAKEQLELMEGVVDFLEFARARYTKIGLTTSSASVLQEGVFAQFGLAAFFDEMVTADHINNGKPHPEPYLKTLEKLGIKSRNALVIEDSKTGIQSALAAGCQVAGIATSHSAAELSEARPTIVVQNFQELKRILE